jgi:hypothetical protein
MKTKLPGVTHHGSKVLPHLAEGGTVGTRKEISATAKGRAAKASREQYAANTASQAELERKIDALRMSSSDVAGGGIKPAQYGNMRKRSPEGDYIQGAPARALDGAAALRVQEYGNYGNIKNVEGKIRADRKQMKEGRR